jgi:ribosomal protein S18 acetylase RimI-like enzyme
MAETKDALSKTIASFVRGDGGTGTVADADAKLELELSRSLDDLDDDRRRLISAALLEVFPDDFRRMSVASSSAHSFVTQTFRAHNGILSLWIDGKLVATAGYSLSGTAYFVSNVWTRPNCRGLGVAKKMVAEVEEEIRGKISKIARVWCAEGLSKFYESIGYSVETRGHRVSRDYFVDVLAKTL